MMVCFVGVLQNERYSIKHILTDVGPPMSVPLHEIARAKATGCFLIRGFCISVTKYTGARSCH